MVRFLFRGFYRESAEPVQGQVEAAGTEDAYQVLSDQGIVTEALCPAVESSGVSGETPVGDRFGDALDSALAASSSQVAFDDLSERYRGKKVWVIDREKIRQRVAQVVDSALAASEANLESSTTARERVADAIKELFKDAQNLAAHHDAERIAKLRAILGAAAQGAGRAGGAALSNADLAEQIGRLNAAVQQAEGLIAAMSAALQNVESGAVPRRRLLPAAPLPDGPQIEVLREIFQSNLDLRRAMAASTPADVRAA